MRPTRARWRLRWPRSRWRCAGRIRWAVPGHRGRGAGREPSRPGAARGGVSSAQLGPPCGCCSPGRGCRTPFRCFWRPASPIGNSCSWWSRSRWRWRIRTPGRPFSGRPPRLFDDCVGVFLVGVTRSSRPCAMRRSISARPCSHPVTEMGYCAPSPGWRRSIRVTRGRCWAVATNGLLP